MNITQKNDGSIGPNWGWGLPQQLLEIRLVPSASESSLRHNNPSPLMAVCCGNNHRTLVPSSFQELGWSVSTPGLTISESRSRGPGRHISLLVAMEWYQEQGTSRGLDLKCCVEAELKAMERHMEESRQKTAQAHRAHRTLAHRTQ